MAISPTNEEVLAEYRARYEAIRQIQIGALGGPVPVLAKGDRPYDIDLERWATILRSASRQWMWHYRLEIRQILACPPDDVAMSYPALWDLNRRSRDLIAHFNDDTVVDERPVEVDERLFTEQLKGAVVGLEVIADGLRDAFNVVPLSQEGLRGGFGVLLDTVNEALKYGRIVINVVGPEQLQPSSPEDTARSALAVEAFVQDKLAHGRMMYYRMPDGTFIEVLPSSEGEETIPD
jgi:hypothetical protein